MAVPVFVISGFLGTGKTTFINHVLETAPPRLKIMVLVNEFGTISIDRKTIKVDPDNIVDLSGGCICCGLFTELMSALRYALDVLKADMVLIESTGLAFPAEIARLTLTPGFEDRIQFGGIIVLVDAADLQLEVHPAVAQQLKAANIVISNKIDRIDRNRLIRVSEKIKAFMPSESILRETSYGKIDFNQIFTKTYGETHLDFKESQPLSEGFDTTAGYAAITLVRRSALRLDRLLKLYDACGDKIIRSKGFVMAETGDVALQLSQSGLQVVDAPKSINRTELVLIVKEKDKLFVAGKFRELFDKNVIAPLPDRALK